MVVDASTSPMVLYVTNESYARKVAPRTFYHQSLKAWYIGPIS